MSGRRPWKLLLVGWILLIVLLCSFPWWVESPQWSRVRWIPVLDVLRSHRVLRDAMANCLLYIPFGFFYAKAQAAPGVTSMWGAALSGLLLSVACELYQVFSPVRFPSMTDVLMNTIGASAGAWTAGRYWAKVESSKP